MHFYMFFVTSIHCFDTTDWNHCRLRQITVVIETDMQLITLFVERKSAHGKTVRHNSEVVASIVQKPRPF